MTARRLPLSSRLFVIPALLVAFSSAAADRPKPSGPSEFADKEAAWEAHLALDAASLFHGLEWRNIGPVTQGGRAVDIESVPGKPYSFFVAYASGGLWRTDNNGVTFEPLFDEQPAIIMGDVAVDPSNPDRVWVGTGENNASRSSYGGYGVWRSDDGGKSWIFRGLGGGDRVGRIVIDPRDGDRVLVGISGKLYTEGGLRGIFRTTDGGDSWEQVLAPRGPWTGVIDMVMHPEDPDVIYAATWERQRRPWEFVEGGDGSAVWKSADGGDTWTRLGGGFPRGDHVGRIGLAISQSNPDILYASIDNQEELPEDMWDLGDAAVTPKRLRSMTRKEFLEQDPEAIEDFIRGNDLDTNLDAETLIRMIENDEITIRDLLDEVEDANADLFNTDIKGLEVYRSEDGGETWRRAHERPIRDVVYTYGYYFGQIRVDPKDPDRVYALGVPIILSEDGGRTWESIHDPDVHVDYQAQWTDPEHPQHVIVGNDGGVDASYDGGETWIKLDSQPVGQFYTIGVDDEDPYFVYGGLQDNGTWKGSSKGQARKNPWQRIGGGDGMHVQVAADGTTYIGFQFGYYFRIDPDGKRTVVRPRDALGAEALRYNWSTPILLSHHHDDILYYGANKLYRSMDRGETWTAISEDLSRRSERGNVPFATLTSLSESPERFGLLWVGTDDGELHVTPDGGVTWTSAAGRLPKDRWVSRVEASRHDAERAYVSLNGYRNDDMTAYVYVTDDLGKSWTSIADGLPDEPVNVVREDPVNENVVYVGTDRGVYVSLDRGKRWQALSAGLPNVPVHDLVVHPRERELVAGTHGRSVFIVDVLPVQELNEVQGEPVHVFPVEPRQYQRAWRSKRSEWFYRPEDDPEVAIPFWSAANGRIVFEILDDDGRTLRRTERDVRRGISAVTWDLLLDKELAVAAERAALEEAGQTDKKERNQDRKDETEKGRKARSPWAEAVRLGWPLYATPGNYTLRVTADHGSAETEFVMEAPEPRQPRKKPRPKMRGEADND
jgi:photosystem II stability/assembly factor-like uncharacterized protein